mgnify:CR=1 FL=1
MHIFASQEEPWIRTFVSLPRSLRSEHSESQVGEQADAGVAGARDSNGFTPEDGLDVIDEDDSFLSLPPVPEEDEEEEDVQRHDRFADAVISMRGGEKITTPTEDHKV